ncbi:MAG: MFS transporter [Chloroflexi bacterium]|nr:MFS transporter [Chloroflexota bacterium]
MAAPPDTVAPTATAATPRPLPHLPTSFRQRTIYYGWQSGFVTFIASIVSTGLHAYTLSVFMVPMSEDLGWTRTDLSFGQTVSTICSGVVAFWVGPLLDRHGGRVLMVVGAIAMGVGFAMLGQVQELWQYYLVKGVLVTAGAACAGSLVMNVALSNWFIRRRGIAIAIGAMGVSVAAIVAPIVCTALIEAYGWRTAWVLTGAGIPLVIVPLALLVMRRRPEDHGLLPDGGPGVRATSKAREASMALQSVVWTRREAMRTRTLWMLVATFSLVSVGLSAILLHLISSFLDRGLTPGQAASAFGMSGAAGLISKPLWGIALDRLNTARCAAAEFLLLGGGLGAVIVADDLLWLHASVFLLGIGIGGTSTVQEVVWADYFGRATIGMIRGLTRPFMVLASAGGPIFASVAFDVRGSYEIAFMFFIATFVCAAVVILFTPYPTPPARPEHAEGVAAVLETR